MAICLARAGAWELQKARVYFTQRGVK
jgi:hypothetical protein